VEQLSLSPEQAEKVAALEKETKAKLNKILTPEQQKILAEFRPPRPRRGGPGGEGGRRRGPDDHPEQGGPGGGSSGDDRPSPPSAF
jgi:hypothetical protein